MTVYGTQCANQAVTLNLSSEVMFLNLCKISAQMVKFEGSYDHQDLNLSITLVKKMKNGFWGAKEALQQKIIVEFVISMLKNPRKQIFKKKFFTIGGTTVGPYRLNSSGPSYY